MKKNLNADLMSVNAGLYDELFIQKLETRLETDPLAVGGLVELTGDDDMIGLLCWSDKNNCSGGSELIVSR